MVKMLPLNQMSGNVWQIMLLFIIYTVKSSVSAHQPPGFISIDCGSSHQYDDKVTGLRWETDEKYISTGLNGVTDSYPSFKVDFPNFLDSYQALQTFRFFPKSRATKYCYELPMARGNILVLTRAMFYFNASSGLVLPITFKIYINSTLWSSVQFEDEPNYQYRNNPVVIESIFYSPGTTTIICLVPDQGVPFISSLELRQLDPEGIMYSFQGRENLLLSTKGRYNVGAPMAVHTVRYPDDAYDRRWTNPIYSRRYNFLCFHDWSLGNNSPGKCISSQKEDANTSSEWNNVPPKVMMTGAFQYDKNVPLEDFFYLVDDESTSDASSHFVYALFYSQALNKTEGVNMVISLNGSSLDAEQSPPFNVSGHPVLTTFSHAVITNVHITSFSASSPSGFGAIINAMEIYEEDLLYPTVTNAADMTFMRFLKTTFNLSYYLQGDPCLPVPDDIVQCDLRNYEDSSQGIVSLSLANLTDSTKLQNAAFLLNSDDPPLRDIYNLTVTYSHIDDGTARFLVELCANGRFMENLVLSHNSLTKFPNFTGTGGTYQFLSLLDLSDNSISSDISSHAGLYSNQILLSGTSIDLSDNLFSGIFPSNLISVFFRGYPERFLSLLDENTRKVTVDSFVMDAGMNLDQNNITGVLNLSVWYDSLREARFNSSLIDQIPYALLSLVNNNILDILPDTDDFLYTIVFFMSLKNHSYFNQSGVLLSGNPYCDNAESTAQRFLCRSTVNEIIYEEQNSSAKSGAKKRRKIIFIAFGTCGGVLLFVLGSVISTIIWRLWQKLSITAKLLQEVQLELSSKKVQPVYYSYADVKAATRGFHQDNRLGSGLQGEVYKRTSRMLTSMENLRKLYSTCKQGILSNGSEIAVKRLFGSNRKQVLNEFLSEVVLISGIRHKHLIQLKGCCIKNEERILIYEFAANGNLAEALWGERKTSTLNWHDRLQVVIGVAHGLSYLHEGVQPRIIHRDIKAPNILLDHNGNAKIADFGLAKHFAEEETHADFTAVAGTRGYFAPEYVMEGQLTTKADVFSYGILLLEVLAGRKCIDPTLPFDQVYIKTWVEDLQRSGMLLELLQPELRESAPEVEFATAMKVALSCIRYDPKSRPTMSQVIMTLLGNLEMEPFEEQSISTSHEVNYNIFGDSEEIPFVE